MKANELRIGNLVNHNGLLNEVKSISERFAVVKDKCFPQMSTEYKYLSGIQLTEEWLHRCEELSSIGTSMNTEYWTYGEIEVDFIYDKTVRVTFADSYEVIATINYVHEWQNLYFAMYRKELTFNHE